MNSDLKRREFMSLLGGAAVSSWPLAARAQQPAKMWRVGIITGGMRSAAYDGFLQGLRELGYVAGKDFTVEWRFADGRYVRFPNLADQLVRLKVDVIFLGEPAAIAPVRQVTRSIPIVMGYSVDPVGHGFVTSLARPGGNVTGLASFGDDAAARQLELLAAAVPQLSRVGLLQNSANPNDAPVLKSMLAAVQQTGVNLVTKDARDPSDIDDALAAFVHEGVQAIKVTSDAFLFSQHQRIAELAFKHRLPAIFAQREYAEAGGLMSYGVNLKEFFRRAASFVDKIFKGAKPGELPIEQPTRLHLVVNRKTANALGLTIPPQLYAAADEVIE